MSQLEKEVGAASSNEIDGVLHRLGLEDLKSQLVGGALPGIDLKESDKYRAERAVKQGLDPATATWQEISQTANSRARTSLGLPATAGIYEIVKARRMLAAEVAKAFATGKEGTLDSKNPEVAYAIKQMTKEVVAKAP